MAALAHGPADGELEPAPDDCDAHVNACADDTAGGPPKDAFSPGARVRWRRPDALIAAVWTTVGLICALLHFLDQAREVEWDVMGEFGPLKHPDLLDAMAFQGSLHSPAWPGTGRGLLRHEREAAAAFDTARAPRGVVYYLVRQTMIHKLHRSLTLLNDNFFSAARRRYPVVFFHDGDFAAEHSAALVSFIAGLTNASAAS
jgi:hypothetical protein